MEVSETGASDSVALQGKSLSVSQHGPGLRSASQAEWSRLKKKPTRTRITTVKGLSQLELHEMCRF